MEKEEYKKFLTKFKSLELSTIGKNGQPETSYAPFVSDQNKYFYIFVSTLARHTKNLLEDGRAGIMLIEAEDKAENIFARKRIIFDCKVNMVLRNSNEWEKILIKFGEIAGDVMETLIMLTDFQLLRLNPISGKFIKGFGSAYKISGDQMDELTHINPKR